MISVHDGQCGKCAHFGEDSNDDRVVQVRVEEGVFVLESEGASRRYSVDELQQLCS